MPFVENLAPFFVTTDFGTAATFTHGAGTPATVNGIFDNGFVPAMDGTVEATGPRFTCAEADVSGVVHGDTLAVNAVTFKVCAVQPDGTGVVLLLLERQ